MPVPSASSVKQRGGLFIFISLSLSLSAGNHVALRVVYPMRATCGYLYPRVRCCRDAVPEMRVNLVIVREHDMKMETLGS